MPITEVILRVGDILHIFRKLRDDARLVGALLKPDKQT